MRVKIIHAREHREGGCSKEEVSRVRMLRRSQRWRLGQDEPLDLVLGAGAGGGGVWLP